jgi:hypothetical protein
MTDLRTAAQQALEALKDCVKALDALHAPGDSIYTRASDSADRAEIALRAALGVGVGEHGGSMFRFFVQCRISTKKGTASCSRGHFYEGSKPFIDPTEVWKLPIGTKLYTRPPRREWRGLTDDEISALFPLPLRSDYKPYSFARAIEAALKERNA